MSYSSGHLQKNSVQEQGCKINRAEQGRRLAFDLQGGRGTVASLPSLPTPPHLPMCDGFLLGYADNLGPSKKSFFVRSPLDKQVLLLLLADD